MIRRIYEADPLTCLACGAEMRIISFLTDPPVVRKILAHVAGSGGTPGRGPPVVAGSKSSSTVLADGLGRGTESRLISVC